MPTRYYTRKRDVPALKKGETVAFAKGKGYYVKPAPKNKVTLEIAGEAKNQAPFTTPVATSVVPAGSGKTTTAAKIAARARLIAAKARHTVVPTKAAKRAQVVAFLRWGVAHAAQIHYAEIRPIPHVAPGKLPSLPFTTDCSGFVTMAYQYAGLPDPNGGGYNGTGYTGTLLVKGTPTVVPKPGDIGVYGPKPGHHAVAALIAGGAEIASHGSEVGPLELAEQVEQRYQPTPLTWLDLEAL